jgi:phosphoribosyl 1,2-cyclic phosphodiesterase
MPVCGAGFLRYGGSTTCFSVETDRHVVIFDAGTGLNRLGCELADHKNRRPILLLFTHFHLDHLIGLPNFKPLYDQHCDITVMGDGSRPEDWRGSLKGFMANPLWPVSLDQLPASPRYKSLNGGMDLGDLVISWCPTRHPQGGLAYRVVSGGVSIAIVTDHECGCEQVDRRLESFCEGADLLILDAQYTPEELTRVQGWGHSSWQQAAGFARRCGARQMLLAHHDPARTDSEIDQIAAQAREIFAQTRAAAEGDVFTAGSLSTAPAG